MYPVGLDGVIVVGAVAWLGVLSWLVWQDRQFLKRLFPEDSNSDIRAKFKELIAEIEALNKNSQVLNRNLRELSKEGLHHVQRLAVLRYNPYEDTGGDVSFSIALLDGAGTGILLTSLHSRAGTRVYIKEVKLGKSSLSLSKEEQSVIAKAMTEDKVS